MANKVELTLGNLNLLDLGKIPAAFQQELQRVVTDCLDRPTDDRARQVSIVFSVKPATDERGDCDSVLVECQIHSAVPKRRTKVYTMRPHTNGALSFHPDLPDEPDGATLYDAPVEK